MSPTRCLLILPLALLGACSHFTSTSQEPRAETQRLQGELRQTGSRVLFQPCGKNQTLLMEDSAGLGLEAEILALDGTSNTLFADLRGVVLPASGNTPERLKVQQRYRLAHEGASCRDQDSLRMTQVRASGNEPGWQVRVASQGLMLDRPGEPSQALPFIEEQLPGGQSSFTSEANGQRLELWLTPQRCVDNMSGAVSHLSAELRLNGQTLRGCGWYGGARHE